MGEDGEARAALARTLIRGAASAVLATSLGGDGWPYGSLVLVACDHDASPILLLSGLAEHSRNIAAYSRLSLLFDGTHGLAERLGGPRLTVLGRAGASTVPRHGARFLARHPEARRYAELGDFGFFSVAVERAHLVAGFGRVEWMEADEVLLDETRARGLAEREQAIVEHMNTDHAEAVSLYANRLLGCDGEGWVMTGCDPEGCDLRRGGATARLDFDAPVADAAEVRTALVALARRARAGAAQSRTNQGDSTAGV